MQTKRTTTQIKSFASLGTLRAALCLLTCWLCLNLSALAGPPPVITTQPTNQTVQVGGTATFVVAASSGTTLTYQWYFQSTIIPGATNNIYTLTNAQFTHAGSYYVAVTNADGGLLSSNAILTIVTYPVIKVDNNSTARTNSRTLSWSHTVSTGHSRLLLVAIATGSSGIASSDATTVTNVTYGGTALTQVGTVAELGNRVRTYIYQMVNPPSGTANVVVNQAAARPVCAGATTFSGVDPITPLGAYASNSVGTDPGIQGGATNAQLAGITSGPGEIVFDVLGLDSDGDTYSLTAGSGQTGLWTQTTSTLFAGGSSIKPGAASAGTMWAWSRADAKQYALGAVSIKPSTRADVMTTTTAASTVFATSNLTYTIVVTNLGLAAATNIVVSDTLPAGLNVVSVSGGGSVVGGGPGQVVFDSASSNNVSGTLTWTHVTTNAANRLMLVGVSLGNYGATSSSAVTALSCGGSNLTKVRALTNGIISSELWQLVNPPTGSNTVTLTYIGTPTTLVAGAATFSGVDQAAPLSALNSATGPRTLSSSVTISSATNEIVFDTIAVDKFFPPIAGAGQTQLWSSSSNYEAGGASIKPGSNSVTMSWTLQNTAWADIVASVKAASPDGLVVFDRASTNNTSGTLNWTHVTTNAANRLMLVGVSLGNYGSTSNSAVTALSCGGANLTKVMAITNGIISSELWQLVNPPSGTNTVTLTYAGTPTTVVAGAATFSGVDPATPLSAVNSGFGPRSINASVTISSATNEIVFDNIAVDKFFPPTAAAGQTQLWSSGPYYEAGGASIKPGTNSVTMSWTLQNIGWAEIAASVKAAPLIGVVNWTIPTLASGASTNFTITVTAPLGGTLTNTVSSTATTPDSNPANNNGSTAAAKVITTVIPIADLVTTLSGPISVPPLTNYTYTVTVSNQGPSTASNVVLTETLAPTLTFVSASAGGTYLAGVVTWPALPSLASGATTNFTVTVRSPLSGTLTNTASSTSATADPNATNNNGSAPAARVVTVVSPLQIADTSFGASVSTLNWSHTVAPGSSRILVVGVSIDNPTNAIVSARFANVLTLTPIGQTNGAQTRVAMYYLINPPVGTYAVSITLASASGIVGGAVSLNGVNQTNPIAAFVGNTGTGTNASLTLASALGAVVIDTLAPKSPQYATNLGTAQTLEWNLSATNYSGAGSSTYGAAAVTPSWALNSAAAWAMAAVALNPATVLADATLTVAGPASVPATSNLTYTISVTNLGSATASNVVVSDVLPAGTTFVSASGGGTHNAGIVTWPTLTNFVNGARTNYTVTLKAPAVGTLTNLVYSTAFTADPDPSNNNGTGTGNQVLTTVTPLADVATTVTGPASVLATTDYSYTLTVTNTGPSPASDVVVSDTLPAGVTFVSASDGGTYNAGVVTWSLGSLDRGAASNFTVTVTAPASGSLLNTVASTSATTDLDLSNNDGSAPAAQVLTTVTPVADVATTVTGPIVAITNAPFRYTVTVTNLGPSGATSLTVSDTLPAGATFISASDGGTQDAGVVTWSLASLESGAATNFTVTVFAPAIGSLTNTVFSSAVTGDPDWSNNDGTTVAAQVVTGVYPLLLLTGQWLPDSGFQVEFYTYPDTIVSIQASTNLVDWDAPLVTTNSGAGHVRFLDPDAASYPMRFYRSRQGP